jgi:hypothetical protein
MDRISDMPKFVLVGILLVFVLDVTCNKGDLIYRISSNAAKNIIMITKPEQLLGLFAIASTVLAIVCGVWSLLGWIARLPNKMHRHFSLLSDGNETLNESPAKMNKPLNKTCIGRTARGGPCKNKVGAGQHCRWHKE